MGMRWRGFRKVRGQVCKRIRRRVDILGLDGFNAYRGYLEEHEEEWAVLDRNCRVTISRWYRDRGVFEQLSTVVLPELACRAVRAARPCVSALSAGCASGEEVFTLRLIWDLQVSPLTPGVNLEIAGVDADPAVLERARRAEYSKRSLRELPEPLLGAGLETVEEAYRVREGFRHSISLTEGDVRTEFPEGPFDIILCRNLAFTYFDANAQGEMARRLADRLRPGGTLVLGGHEELPSGPQCFEREGSLPIYRLT